MLTVLFIAQKQQQNSSTLDVNLKPLSPWLFLKKKEKEKDLPYCLFVCFAIPFNEKSFVLLKKTKNKKQLINTPTLLVLFFYSPVVKDQPRERPS